MSKLRQRRRARGLRAPNQRIFTVLLDLYQRLHQPQPLDQLLQAVLDAAISCVPGAQRGSLMVQEGDRLRYRAAYGYDLAALAAVSFPASGVRDSFLERRQLLQVIDFIEWDRSWLPEADTAILLEHGHLDQIRRSIVAAILVDGSFYGTLVLDNLRSQRAFPAEAETIARLFAAQAGVLISQALLVERLRSSRSRLIEAERLASLGRFIAGIAHEINNPLTAVLGYADFLAESGLSPSQQQMLGHLQSGMDRVRAIVRNLQVFARQQQAGLSQVSLNLVVEQTVTLKRLDLVMAQVDLSVSLEPDLPPIVADSGQLSQVLLNLITNAQQALGHVGLPRRLELRTSQERRAGQGWLIVSVADNGPGVPPGVAEQIFEPYFTTTPPGQGAGLGLSICREIAEAHGGRLRIDAAHSPGARFVLELPLERPAPQPDPPAPAAGPNGSIGGLHILLVEDRPEVVELVQQTLADGNQISLAGSGREALRLVADTSYDLLLCDLKLPEIDGLEFFARLASDLPALAARLIFIGDAGGMASSRQALARTRRPLLASPFTSVELRQAIWQLLGA